MKRVMYADLNYMVTANILFDLESSEQRANVETVGPLLGDFVRAVKPQCVSESEFMRSFYTITALITVFLPTTDLGL